MALFGKGVDRVAGEIRKLRIAFEKLEDEQRADELKLETLEASAPAAELDAFLAGAEPPFDQRGEAAKLRGAILRRAGLRRALIGRLIDAVRSLNAARADSLRKEADQLANDRAKHMVRVNELLLGLQNLEGIPYINGCAVSPEGMLVALAPRSSQMQFRIEKLRLEAANAEQARVSAAGSVAGHSLEELLAAANDNPLSPTQAAIESWFRDVDAQSEREFEREFPHGQFRADTSVDSVTYHGGEVRPVQRETSYELIWDDELRVDPDRSSFRNQARVVRTDRQQVPAVAIAS